MHGQPSPRPSQPASRPPAAAQGSCDRTERGDAAPSIPPRIDGRLTPRAFAILFVGALCVAIFGSTYLRLFRSSAGIDDSDSTELRLAHWQVHDDARAAFDGLALSYAARHSSFRVEQMQVPSRSWLAWQRTQLVGGMAPDLVQLGRGSTEEVLAAYFLPLTEALRAPNPYNAGTALAGVPWKDTFLDGLEGPPNFEPALLDYYGVPMLLNTVRIYYNRTLLRQITGRDEPPEPFDAFVALCTELAAARTARGDRLVPLAASRDTAPFLIERLFAAQTQRLALALDRWKRLQLSAAELGIAHLEGRWSLDTHDVRRGLELSREVSRFFWPGFLQLQRDDAVFNFTQGNALMLCSGVFEAISILSQASFEVGVLPIPFPSPAHPLYGPQTLGTPSEANTFSDGAFGITRTSKNPEQALDFLRFMTSQPANAAFVARSHRVSAVMGVEPEPKLQAFLPKTEGPPPGFTLMLLTGAGSGLGGGQVQRVYQTAQHRLYAANGGVDAFVAQIRTPYAEALRQDLSRYAEDRRKGTRRDDSLLVADFAHRGAAMVAGDERFATRFESQNLREAEEARVRRALRESAARSR